MTVMIACSTSFMAPASNHDVKVGLPLFILTMLISVALVMLIYHP